MAETLSFSVIACIFLAGTQVPADSMPPLRVQLVSLRTTKAWIYVSKIP